MGIYLNNQKLAKPFLNGTGHNAYVAGGKVWSSGAPPEFAAAKYIGIPYNSQKIILSQDGITWSEKQSNIPSNSYNLAAWSPYASSTYDQGLGTMIALKSNASLRSDIVISYDKGFTWTAGCDGFNEYDGWVYTKLLSAGRYFILIAGNSNTIYSANASIAGRLNFAARSNTTGATGWNDLAYDGSQYVCIVGQSASQELCYAMNMNSGRVDVSSSYAVSLIGSDLGGTTLETAAWFNGRFVVGNKNSGIVTSSNSLNRAALSNSQTLGVTGLTRCRFGVYAPASGTSCLFAFPLPVSTGAYTVSTGATYTWNSWNSVYTGGNMASQTISTPRGCWVFYSNGNNSRFYRSATDYDELPTLSSASYRIGVFVS
jgi:hypothetical protein